MGVILKVIGGFIVLFCLLLMAAKFGAFVAQEAIGKAFNTTTQEVNEE